jgi:hypothetical protein
MQKLKLFLAWLDWSTYARTSEGSWKSNYNFPKSLCSLAWRTKFSVAMLPITWFTHVWNRLFVSMDTFRREDSDSHKLNVWSTLAFTLVSLILGMIVHNNTDGKDGSGGWGWDLFHMSDPLIINYLKLLGCGVIFGAIIALIILIVIAIVGLIIMAFETLFPKNSVSDSKSATINAIKAVKNKYCPTMDWSSIKKK